MGFRVSEIFSSAFIHDFQEEVIVVPVVVGFTLYGLYEIVCPQHLSRRNPVDCMCNDPSLAWTARILVSSTDLNPSKSLLPVASDNPLLQ